MKTLLKGNRTRISDFIKVVIVSIIAVLFCRSNLMGVSDATEILLNAINDEKFVSMAAEKDLHLVNGSKLVFDELLLSEISKKRVCKSFSFKRFIGTTSQAVKEFSKKYSGDQISAMIYANSTYFGGGVLYGAGAQEESSLRDMNPVTVCHLIGKNLISKKENGNYFDLMYEGAMSCANKMLHREPILSPVTGFLIDGKLDRVNSVKNPERTNFRALFAALPSLNGYCIDENSFELFRLFGAELMNLRRSEKEDTEKILNSVESFSEKFLSECKLSGDELRRALIICMCSDKCSSYGRNEDAVMADIVHFAKAKKGDKDFLVFEEAKQNYENMLHSIIRSWIVMARKDGIKCFIGGPIGCGVFQNDVNVVAKIFAEEFVNYGGDMTFVCAVPDESISNIFETEFKKAFSKMSRITGGAFKDKNKSNGKSQNADAQNTKNGEKSWGITEKANVILHFINDDEFLKTTGEIDLNIVTCDKYIENAERWKSPSTSKVFKAVGGGTSHVIKELHENDPDEKIAVMIYADATNCGGYFESATTQEEEIFRDMGPVVPCHLLSKGLISKSELYGHTVLPYDDIPTYANKKANGELSLSPAVGFAIDAKLLSDGSEKFHLIPFRALFCAMPSLSGEKMNFDVNGATFHRLQTELGYISKCRLSYEKFYKDVFEKLYQKRIDPNDVKSVINRICKYAKNFVDKLYQRRTDPDDVVGRMDSDEFKRAMILWMCSEECSVFYDLQGEDAAMEKLIRCAKATEGEDHRVFKRAEENYKKMLHKTIRSWIITARESGAKYFVGGPIGCGAFYNDVKLVAQIFAEEFRDYGGNMQFVYPKFRKKDANCDTFKNAFDEAFKKLLNKS